MAPKRARADGGASEPKKKMAATKKNTAGIVPQAPQEEVVVPVPTTADNEKASRERDLFESSDRALKNKFSHVSPERLDALRDKDGKAAVDLVMIQKAKMKNGKHIPTKFWMDLEKALGLEKASAFDNIPPPSAAESFDLELWNAIESTRDKNPAHRQTTSFTSHLAYAENLNETELFGAMKACAPQVNLSILHAEEMQRALLQYCASNKVHEKYPNLWGAVRAHFEVLIKNAWLDNVAIGRDLFVEANLATISMFVDGEKVKNVEQAIATKKDLPLTDLRELMTSTLGSALYQDHGVKLQWLQYIEKIGKGINTLFHNDFDMQEVKNFEGLMAREAKILSTSGHTMCDKKTQSCSFLSVAQMEVPSCNANDSWKNLLSATKKGLAFNALAVPRLQFEVLIYGKEDKIPGIADGMQIPVAFLTDTIFCRKAAALILGETPLTIKDQIKTLKPHFAELRKMDYCWHFEWNFLVHYAEKLLEKGAIEKIVQSFPKVSQDPQAEMQAVLDCIDVVKASPQVHALPLTFTKQLTSIYGLMRNLMAAVAPESKDVDKMGEWQLSVLKASDVWCSFKVDKDSDVVGAPKKGSMIYGKPALLEKFRVIKEACDRGEVKSLKEIEDLRRFNWMLTAEQQQLVTTWVAAGVRVHRASATAYAIKDGDAVAEIPVASAASSSSSLGVACSIVPLVKSTSTANMSKAVQAKKQDKEDLELKARKAAMLKMLGSKAKV